MDITYISQRTLPDLLTGSERYIHDLAKYMSKKYSVEIIATGQSENVGSKLIYDNICVKTFKESSIGYKTGKITDKIRRLNKQWLLDIYSKPFNGFIHSTSWGYFSFSMKKYLEKHQIELIHSAAIPTATAWLSWRVSRKMNIPFVFTPFLHYESIDFKVPWVKSLLRDSSTVIAVTNKEKEALINFGVNASNIQVIPLGIDYRIYSKTNLNSFRKLSGFTEDMFVILIPRKAKGKGTYDTLRAIVNLSHKYNKLGLILLDRTTKEVEPVLSEYLRTLTLNGVKVIDLGYVSGQSLIEAYQVSDVVVQPTIVDSFSIIFLEAWACGKPVIAANYGAIPEIIHEGSNGLLVNYGNFEDIERAIITLINDVNLKTKLGENGRQDVIKKYSVENMVQKTEQIYGSIKNK
jgi:glycosyltransferase involved in cell wall biosynthesis